MKTIVGRSSLRAGKNAWSFIRNGSENKRQHLVLLVVVKEGKIKSVLLNAVVAHLRDVMNCINSDIRNKKIRKKGCYLLTERTFCSLKL